MHFLHNIKPVYLHCVFHGIRFKVNEDWESGKIPFFYVYNFIICFHIFYRIDTVQIGAIML